jgi:hypothetical protein
VREKGKGEEELRRRREKGKSVVRVEKGRKRERSG